MNSYTIRGPVFDSQDQDVTEGVETVTLDEAIELATSSHVDLALLDEQGSTRGWVHADGTYSVQ